MVTAEALVVTPAAVAQEVGVVAAAAAEEGEMAGVGEVGLVAEAEPAA